MPNIMSRLGQGKHYQHLVGRRIELINTSDPYTELKPGDKGIVAFVDSSGTLHINWDCGSKLGLLPGYDQYKVLD